MDAPRLDGFTLLETLVMLVIVSLTSVLIMQGLAQALDLRERVLEHTEYQREDALRRAWFGDSVRSLVADLARIENHRFEGDATGFKGLTLAALQAFPGLPRVVNWRLERDGEVFHLFYSQQGDAPQRVWSWRAEAARFSYYAPETGWVDAWPPQDSDARPLPSLVAFETTWRDEPRSWVAAVAGRRSARPSLRLDEEFR